MNAETLERELRALAELVGEQGRALVELAAADVDRDQLRAELRATGREMVAAALRELELLARITRH